FFYSVILYSFLSFFFFSSRRRHTRSKRDWSSDVCSSDLPFSITISISIPFTRFTLCNTNRFCICYATFISLHFIRLHFSCTNNNTENCLSKYNVIMFKGYLFQYSKKHRKKVGRCCINHIDHRTEYYFKKQNITLKRLVTLFKCSGITPNAFLLNILRPNLSLIPCQRPVQHKRQHTTRENYNRHWYSGMIAGNSDEWRNKRTAGKRQDPKKC